MRIKMHAPEKFENFSIVKNETNTNFDETVEKHVHRRR